MTGDPFDLQRFVRAQDGGAAYERALGELRRGRKTGHWMWFVFPQVAGLGTTEMSRRYAIASLAEARAYLAHAVLGARLDGCAGVVAATDEPVERIFGPVDAQKLHSSMTLFHRADPQIGSFSSVLHRHFDGALDAATEQRL